MKDIEKCFADIDRNTCYCLDEKEAIKTISIKAVTSKAECEDYPSCICLKKRFIVNFKSNRKTTKRKR